ncbi:hypothetical protein [Ornithinimicrobium kibberense]
MDLPHLPLARLGQPEVRHGAGPGPGRGRRGVRGRRRARRG